MSIVVIECRHGMPDFLCRRCHPELNGPGTAMFVATAVRADPRRDFYQPKGMSDAEWGQIKQERLMAEAKRSLAALEARADLATRPNLASLVNSLRNKIAAAETRVS
jgi:hypothetical protein